MEINQTEAGQGLNLVEQADKTKKQPRGFWRLLFVDAASILSALLFGSFYLLYLFGGFSAWWALGMGIIFATASAMQVFVAASPERRMIVMLIEVVVMTLPYFFFDTFLVVAIAFIIVAGFLAWGYFSSSIEFHNQVEVRFFKSTAGVIGKVTTALLFFILIVYAPIAHGDGVFVPRSSFKTFFDWSSGILNRIYPGVKFDASFSSFSSSFVKAELSHNPSFLALPAPQRDATIVATEENFSDSITQATGIRPTSNEPVSDVAYDYLVSTLNNWKSQWDGTFVIIWIIVLFLVFRTIAFIFVWVAQLISLATYEILLATGFMHITSTVKSKDLIVF